MNNKRLPKWKKRFWCAEKIHISTENYLMAMQIYTRFQCLILCGKSRMNYYILWLWIVKVIRNPRNPRCAWDLMGITTNQQNIELALNSWNVQISTTVQHNTLRSMLQHFCYCMVRCDKCSFIFPTRNRNRELENEVQDLHIFIVQKHYKGHLIGNLSKFQL